MSEQQHSRLVTSPWRVVEVFVIYLAASTVGEFMGAAMGEGAQLDLAVMELALGLLLSWPALMGKRWGYVLMGGYLLYFGLSLFWLLLRGAPLFSWAYQGTLSLYLAAGGLKMLLTQPEQPAKKRD
jgi:hypothetical protein